MLKFLVTIKEIEIEYGQVKNWKLKNLNLSNKRQKKRNKQEAYGIGIG